MTHGAIAEKELPRLGYYWNGYLLSVLSNLISRIGPSSPIKIVCNWSRSCPILDTSETTGDCYFADRDVVIIENDLKLFEIACPPDTDLETKFPFTGNAFLINQLSPLLERRNNSY